MRFPETENNLVEADRRLHWESGRHGRSTRPRVPRLQRRIRTRL